MSQDLHIRNAASAELPAIERLRRYSAKVLTGTCYTEEMIDTALAAGERDREMIHAGTFFVGTLSNTIVGTAAWSPNPGSAAGATIRSVYVHPQAAGRNIGRKLMDFVERHAILCGCSRLELQSSLTGVGFYRRLGYRAIGCRLVPLGDGPALPVMQMDKRASRAGRPL